MEIDFKKTIWEKIHIPKEKEEEAWKIIESSSSAITKNHELCNIEGANHHNIDNTEKIMEDYENGGAPTIEVLDDEGNSIWSNGEEPVTRKKITNG